MDHWRNASICLALIPSLFSEANRSETRMGEIIAHGLLFPVMKLFPTALSIPIGKVAKAMCLVASQPFATATDDVNSSFHNKMIHHIVDGEIKESASN